MNWLSLTSISKHHLSQSRLVIGTVWNWNQLPIFFLWRVPTLKIKFSNRSIIQLSRDNIDNLIWNLKGLIKLFTDLKHPFHFITTLIRMTNDKLLYFFKLMNSKQSMNILPMSTSLLSKTWWVSAHFDRKLLWFKDFAFIISRQWLLTCGN